MRAGSGASPFFGHLEEGRANIRVRLAGLTDPRSGSSGGLDSDPPSSCRSRLVSQHLTSSNRAGGTKRP